MTYPNVKEWMQLTWVLALALALFSACDATPEYVEEAEEEGLIEATEVEDNTFGAETNYYTDWDRNRDEYLDSDEIGAGTYGLYDEDRDGRLNQEEWGLFEGAFSDNEIGEFEAWDANRDGFLDNDEYATGFGNSGIYNSWDANRDNRIDADEFSRWER